MKKVTLLLLAMFCFILTACSNTMMQGQHSENTVLAKNKVNFKLPSSQKWDLVSVEQDANGYAKSYRSRSAKGPSADQSFYINYGYGIKTPLLDAMHEVTGSLTHTGCKQTNSKVEKSGKNTLVFTISADHCTNGRSVWQVFKVFNMMDGQYSIVYSANPHVVPTKTRQQMKNVVAHATISAMP